MAASASASRADHQLWLDSLYAARRSTSMGSRTSGSAPVGEPPSPPRLGRPSHPESSGPSMLRRSEPASDAQAFDEPVVYRSARLGDEFVDVDSIDAHLESRYRSLSLEADDEPVYRSLGMGLFGDAAAGLPMEDEPVYRSLGDLFSSGALPSEIGTVGQDVDDDHGAPPDWLESMPPLVCRQRGRTSL